MLILEEVMEPILSIKDLTAGYGDADILHGVNMEIMAHEIVTIVGPNGAGKSTIFNAIMGLINIRGGDIRFKGQSLLKHPTEGLRDIGLTYLPQVSNVFPSLTVEENLIVGMPKEPLLTTRIDEVLALFPALKSMLSMRASQLSGGERQMLAFARGLMPNPSLMLLDEPSAALSPVLAGAIFEKIVAINDSGKAIVLVEQNVSRALEICHRGYVLDSGCNALKGTGRELLNHPDMATLYLGGAKRT
jgi:neutral amino acid transport system ATP-binding protein